MKRRREKITGLPYRLVREDTTEVTFKTYPEAKRALMKSFERNGVGGTVYHQGRAVFTLFQLPLPLGDPEALADRPMTPELRAKVLAQRSEYRDGRYRRTAR